MEKDVSILHVAKPQMKRGTPGAHPETYCCSILQFWCLEQLLFLFIVEDLCVQHGAEWFLPHVLVK